MAKAGAVIDFHNAPISAPLIVSAVMSALVVAATKRRARARGWYGQ